MIINTVGARMQISPMEDTNLTAMKTMNNTSPVECWEVTFDPESGSGKFATPIIIAGLLALITLAANISVLYIIFSTETLRKRENGLISSSLLIFILPEF